MAATPAEKEFKGRFVQHLDLGLGKVRAVYDNVNVEFLSQFSEAHGTIWPHIRFASDPDVNNEERPLSELIDLADQPAAAMTFSRELHSKGIAWRAHIRQAQQAALNNTDADSLRAVLVDVALDRAVSLGDFASRWAKFHGVSDRDFDPKALKRKIDKAVEIGTIERYRAGEWIRIGKGADGTSRETWVYTLPGRFEQLQHSDEERQAERKAAREVAAELQRELAGLGIGGVGVDQHGIECDLTIPADQVRKLLDLFDSVLD